MGKGGDPNIVRPITSRIKGKAQFECKDGLITVDDRYDVKKCVSAAVLMAMYSPQLTK